MSDFLTNHVNKNWKNKILYKVEYKALCRSEIKYNARYRTIRIDGEHKYAIKRFRETYSH